MRQSEKDELIERLLDIDAQKNVVKDAILSGEPRSLYEAFFQLGAQEATICQLIKDIQNTGADPEEDAPELPAQAPAAEDAGITLAGSGGWKKYKAALKDEAGTAGAEKEAEDTEDVILPKEEEQAVSTGARIIVSNLPEASMLPPTKEARVPDEELPKPRRRGGRPKKKFTLEEELPDPLE